MNHISLVERFETFSNVSENVANLRFGKMVFWVLFKKFERVFTMFHLLIKLKIRGKIDKYVPLSKVVHLQSKHCSNGQYRCFRHRN